MLLLAHIKYLAISTRSDMSLIHLLVLMPIRIHIANRVIFRFILVKIIQNLICMLGAINLWEELLGVSS